MLITNIFGAAYGSKKPHNSFWILPLGIFTIVSLLPSNVLAFESRIAYSAAQSLVIYRAPEGQDVFAHISPNHLPQYTYAQAGVAIAYASPVTIINRGLFTPRVGIIRQTLLAIPTNTIPTNINPLVLEGEASYYSWAGCLGCNPRRIMANGEQLNDNTLTMAIGADRKHLVGRTARVTSLVTGKSVQVRITDTGGFYQAKYGHRVADLSVATKQAVGMAGGTGQVRVEVF